MVDRGDSRHDGREKDDKWTWDVFKQWPEDCQWVFRDSRTRKAGNNAIGIEGHHIGETFK
jgi:hypothetical protein